MSKMGFETLLKHSKQMVNVHKDIIFENVVLKPIDNNNISKCVLYIAYRMRLFNAKIQKNTFEENKDYFFELAFASKLYNMKEIKKYYKKNTNYKQKKVFESLCNLVLNKMRENYSRIINRNYSNLHHILSGKTLIKPINLIAFLEKEKIECPICYDEDETSSIYLSVCNHCVCNNCRRRGPFYTCPICRSVTFNDQYYAKQN